MNHTFTSTLMLCATAAMLTGCVQRAPFLESQMGQSLSMIKAQQVMRPDAGKNTDPVAGMDAKAAKGAQDRYQQSFKAPEPQPQAFTIGIGGSR